VKANPSNNTNSSVNSKGPTIAAVVKSSVSNHTTTTSSVSTTVSQSITTQTSTTTVGNFATVAASNIHNKHTRKFYLSSKIKSTINDLN